MRGLEIELWQLLEETKRRQETQLAIRSGAIVVRNRDGTTTVIRLEFVVALGHDETVES